MKKNNLIELISSILVIVLVVLGYNLYTTYNATKKSASTYALATYNLDISGFNYINSVIDDNKVYLLYNSNNYYLVRIIDNITSEEESYSYGIDGVCKLQNENSYPYIYCTDNYNVKIYNVKFQNIITQKISTNYNYAINTNGDNLSFKIVDNNNSYEYINGYYERTKNSFVSLDSPFVLEAYCTDNCLLLRYNDLNEVTSLYKDNELLETNILGYQSYSNGIYTYDDNTIKIYNALLDSYNKYTSPIDNLLSNIFTLGTNNEYLYVLNREVIDVYDLFSGDIVTRIDAQKIADNVTKLQVINNYLYVYGDYNLYIYNISDIEHTNETSSSDISDKIDFYQEYYGVTINLEDNPNNLSNDYQIVKATNNNDITEALDELEYYFLVFNQEFFSRFSTHGMDGLNIYFASSISSGNHGSSESAEIVGLYLNKDNKYNIVICINSNEDILNIIFHETFHAIEAYLRAFNVTFSRWNSLNPSGFTYTNVYYTNMTFSDVYGYNNNANEIYFVDNYARSSEMEDRARTFEQVGLGTNLTNYPHLNAKVNYLKQVLLTNFPELKTSRYFV